MLKISRWLRTRAEIDGNAALMHRVHYNFAQRIELCISHEGQHTEHIMYCHVTSVNFCPVVTCSFNLSVKLGTAKTAFLKLTMRVVTDNVQKGNFEHNNDDMSL